MLGMAVPAFAQEKEQDRLHESAVVMKEILDIPEGIPQNILHKAECVIVFPSVLKFAIGIGGSYGRGAITCRTGAKHNGPWSAPAMMALEGGNIGLQLGGRRRAYRCPRAENAGMLLCRLSSSARPDDRAPDAGVGSDRRRHRR